MRDGADCLLVITYNEERFVPNDTHYLTFPRQCHALPWIIMTLPWYRHCITMARPPAMVRATAMSWRCHGMCYCKRHGTAIARHKGAYCHVSHVSHLFSGAVFRSPTCGHNSRPTLTFAGHY